jgi:aryl-alcohol dehydrogenase-like predicted oxidoreductase
MHVATSEMRLGLGMAALGRPGYINLRHGEDMPPGHSREAMLLRAMEVLDEAWNSGVRYFDAARSYGAAEEFLATWLRIRQISSAQITVGSKWGYEYTAMWQIRADRHEVKEHTLAALRRQISESSAHLGGFLRLYQIHSATLESGVLNDEAVLDELARLRDGGLAIGLSVSGPNQSSVVEKALGIRRGLEPLFASVQATWNLLERSVEPMLDAAHSQGRLVIVKEALANGRLTDRGLPADSTLGGLSRELGLGPDAVALASVLARPWADLVLSGAATVGQLKSNLQAIQVAWRNEYDVRLADMQELSDEYWMQRSRLPWN